MPVTFSIRSADLSDLNAVRSLLAASDLPTDDVDGSSVTLFCAYDGTSLVGVVGLQACDNVGLLRSLAVAPPARSRGVARLLCDHVIREAQGRGMTSLWLLTTTAKDYFVRHGFAVTSRDSAPESIRTTAQFSSLCPSSAVLMCRQ